MHWIWSSIYIEWEKPLGSFSNPQFVLYQEKCAQGSKNFLPGSKPCTFISLYTLSSSFPIYPPFYPFPFLSLFLSLSFHSSLAFSPFFPLPTVSLSLVPSWEICGFSVRFPVTPLPRYFVFFEPWVHSTFGDPLVVVKANELRVIQLMNDKQPSCDFHLFCSYFKQIRLDSQDPRVNATLHSKHRE